MVTAMVEGPGEHFSEGQSAENRVWQSVVVELLLAPVFEHRTQISAEFPATGEKLFLIGDR